MIIIPAVDLLDRCVVRVEQGDLNRVKVYSDDPLGMVRKFAENGASLIHLVDLNAAIRKDSVTNESTIASIIKDICGSVAIQVAGGIRDISSVRRLYEMGARRVVLSSLAYSNLEATIEILRAFDPDSLVLALDYDRTSKVRTSGWLKQEGETVDSALSRFAKIGFKQFVTTATARDGMMAGPDIDMLERISKIRERHTIRIIASGGITTVEDIMHLSKIGIDEAIVGKAIYEGLLPLTSLRAV